MKNKLFWFSLILLVTGIIFGNIENTYYQYLDNNNVLIESWFMPLSILFIFLGTLGLLFIAIKASLLAIKKI
jgi:hypothetical protein